MVDFLCGRAGARSGPSSCAAADVLRSRGRLSGPLADRLDMHVAVGAVPIAALGSAAPAERSADIAARVARARRVQLSRYRELRSVQCNAHVSGRWLDVHGAIDPAARDLLGAAAQRLALSARGYHRVLKVARTIADLDGDARVTLPAVAEALRYRAAPPTPATAPARGAAAGGAPPVRAAPPAALH